MKTNIKILTGIHENYDGLGCFTALTNIKIMTSLIYHILGGLAVRGCQPSNRQGSQWVAVQLGDV